MKENGMNKLIELLNEFDNTDNWEVTDYGALFNRMSEGISETEDLQVISKKYGFIQWLVDNDKIDFDKNDYPLRYNSYYPDRFGIVSIGVDDYEEYLRVDYDRCETLLMLLTISDTPIEDLISYLKIS